MANQQPNRQDWFPPISKQPTPEEVARHLYQLYRAINNHDRAIVQLNRKIVPPPATQKTAAKKLKLP